MSGRISNNRLIRFHNGFFFLSKFVREVQFALGFTGGFSNLVPNELDGLSVAGEELLEGDVDFADVAISEGALAAELEDEGEAVLVGGGGVDGELHGEVPVRVTVALGVDGGPDLLGVGRAPGD